MKRKITLCILLILIIVCVTLLSYEKINKESINNDNTGMFAIYLEEEKNSGKYQKSNLKTWPTEEEYTINMLKSYCENESKIYYKDGKITKEELDRCSTCDLNAVVHDGLSKESKEQLKNMTGEQIVENDLKEQMNKKIEP